MDQSAFYRQYLRDQARAVALENALAFYRSYVADVNTMRAQAYDLRALRADFR